MEAKIEDSRSRSTELDLALEHKRKLSRLRLEKWEECVGIFKGIERDEFSVSVIIDESKVVFNWDSAEAKIIDEKFSHEIIGERIAILSTDDPNKPLRVKIDRRRDETPPQPLAFINSIENENNQELSGMKVGTVATVPTSANSEHRHRTKEGDH